VEVILFLGQSFLPAAAAGVTELAQGLVVVQVAQVEEPLLHMMELLLLLQAVARHLPYKGIVVVTQSRLVQMFAMVEEEAPAQPVVMYQARLRRLEVAVRVYLVQLQALLLPVAEAVEAETVKQLPAQVAPVAEAPVAQIML